MTVKVQTINECLDAVIAARGNALVVASPLGIGKPNPLLNAIWDKAKQDPSISLEIFTALSLEVPRGKSLLEKRFLKPFTDRYFSDYPQLTYINDVKKGSVPTNMKLTEFYMQSGKMLRSPFAQRHYTSSNYTHAARDMLAKGLNVVMQMVAIKHTASGPIYSLSSNTDLTFDINTICENKKYQKPFIVAMVNPFMPFMGGEGQVQAGFFDLIIDNEDLHFKPFATPRAAINRVDYNIGLLTSTLIRDGGTLQVGIGSLADALIYATKLRHQHNDDYLQLINKMGIKEKFNRTIKKSGSLSIYKNGLYAASEMFVEGFAHLYKAGILKRKVYADAQIQTLINQNLLTEQVPENIIEILLQNGVLDEFITKKQMQRLQSLGILKPGLQMKKGYMQDIDGNKFQIDLLEYKNIKAIQSYCLNEKLKGGVILHAGFFLGSHWFYQWLRELSVKEQKLFQMTSVSQVNELYGNEALDRVQRVNARFINTCMKVDVLGAAASDTLDNNQVVSGVGGQYNFVAMAHALDNSRSILMLRSTHKSKYGLESNIVWKYSYCTIPRHLRDIVVTEYGIADLRGQSDEECIKRMICIADSQFQQQLKNKAIKYNKLNPNWSVPEPFSQNTTQSIKEKFTKFNAQGYFPEYPFGSDFNDEELKIIKALKYLKAQTKTPVAKIKTVIKAYLNHEKNEKVSIYLKRMQLTSPKGFEERIAQKLLKLALNKIG